MFFFGDPADIAQNYITEAMSEPGPQLTEAPLEELNAEQALYATAYVRMAFDRAKRYDDAPREILDALIEVYDEVFAHLLALDPRISQQFRIGNHKYLEHTPENIAKYTAMVDMYAPSAN